MTNITTNDAMRKFGVSRVQIYNWAKLGKIVKIKSGVYSEESIQKHINEHNVRTNSRETDVKEAAVKTPMDALLVELAKLDGKELPEQWKAEIALKCADFYFAKPNEALPVISDTAKPEVVSETIEHSDAYIKCLEDTIEQLKQRLNEKPAEVVKEVPCVPAEVEEKLLDLQTLAENQTKEIERLNRKLAKQAKPEEIEQLKANLASKLLEIAQLKETINGYQAESYNAASPQEKAVIEKLANVSDSDDPAKK